MGPTALERVAMIVDLPSRSLFLCLLLLCGWQTLHAEDQRTTLLVVAGASGEASYAEIFAEELKLWRDVAAKSEVRLTVIGDTPTTDTENDKQRLATVLKAEQGAAFKDVPLWIVLIGHGTFDGRVAAFNMRGPDITNTELADWLKLCERPLAVINTTAASAPFLTALSGPQRVVITATKSGQEKNYARFGRYFAKRVIDPTADLDKDEQTSLLEAYLAAARDTAEFYKNENRIATEHPLLDDNGDGRGIRLELFTRDRLTKPLANNQPADGDLARRLHLHPHAAERLLTPEQMERRNELEQQLAALRARKAELDEAEYFEQLEKLLVELARLYAPSKP
jgi:hypothetical protein